MLSRSTTTPRQYNELISFLKETYDQKRLIHQHHVLALVNSQPFKSSTHEEYVHFEQTLTHSVSCLKDSGQFAIGPFLTSLLTTKLTKAICDQWLLYTQNTKVAPDFKVFMYFVQHKRRTTTPSTASPRPKVKPPKESQRKSKEPIHTTHSNHVRSQQSTCTLCGGEHHQVYLCPTFKTKSMEAKQEYVRLNNLYFNCLSPGHRTRDCSSSNRCRRCGGSHHTCLHEDRVPPSPTEAHVTQSTIHQPPTQPVNSTTTARPDEPTLLMTAQVIVEEPKGKRMQARAFLDSGAAVSMVSRRLTQQLNLKRYPCDIKFVGAMESTVGSSSHSVSLTLKSSRTISFSMPVTASVVDKASMDLPLQEVTNVKNYPHLQGLDLADPKFDTPSRIDILLGNGICPYIELPDPKRGKFPDPVATNTVFGWAIAGMCRTIPNQPEPASAIISHIATSPSYEELIQRFWDIEKVASTQCHTPEEQVTVDHFHATHSFLSSGIYEVSLPK